MYRDHKMEYIYSLLRCQRNLILQFSRYKTLYKTWKNKYEFYLHCWDHVCKANEWCLFDCASTTNLEFLLKQWYVITALQNAKSVPPVTGF